jgi:hypothetical protein
MLHTAETGSRRLPLIVLGILYLTLLVKNLNTKPAQNRNQHQTVIA